MRRQGGRGWDSPSPRPSPAWRGRIAVRWFVTPIDYFGSLFQRIRKEAKGGFPWKWVRGGQSCILSMNRAAGSRHNRQAGCLPYGTLRFQNRVYGFCGGNEGNESGNEMVSMFGRGVVIGEFEYERKRRIAPLNGGKMGLLFPCFWLPRRVVMAGRISHLAITV
jgi:hypothetical protein